MSKEAKGLTKRALILGTIAAILGPMIASYFMSLGLSNTSEYAWTVAGPFTVFAFIIPVYLLLSYLAPRLKIHPYEMVVIYSMLAISMTISILPSWVIGIHMNAVFDETVRTTTLGGGAYMPSLWAPPYDPEVYGVVGGILPETTGYFLPFRPFRVIPLGRPVPWGAWIVPITYYIVLFVAIGLFQFFLFMIFRNRFIDVEKLPFPYAQAGMELLKAGGIGSSKKSERILGLPPFWLGALIGFAFYLPHILANWFRQGWAHPTWYTDLIAWGVDATSTYNLRNIALILAFDPRWIALAFLMPLDVLFTAIVWHLFFYIIAPIIQVSLGLYVPPAAQNAGNIYYTFGHWMDRGFTPHSIEQGMWVGVGLFVIIFNLRYLIGTFRAKGESVEKEPMPYKLAWIGLFSTFVLIVILLAISGMGTIAPFLAIWVLLTYLSLARFRSVSGYWSSYWWFGPWLHEKSEIWSIPFISSGAYRSQAHFTSLDTAIFMTTDRALESNQGAPLLESFKFADFTGLRPKSLLVPQVLAIVLGVAISFPLYIWGVYTYGWSTWSQHPDFGYWQNWVGYPMNQNKIADFPPYPPETLGNPFVNRWLFQYFAGMLLAGLLMFLKARFIWFPLNAVGVLYASVGFLGCYMFTINIIAYVLKWVILKFGGARIYEKYAFPFFAGLLIFGMVTWYFGEIGPRYVT